MEPRQTGPGNGIELPPVQAGGYSETQTGVAGPETGFDAQTGANVEQNRPVPAELNKTPLATPVIPMPVVADDATTNTLIVADDSANAPLTAGDDDLIEKEWVDKAKQIITSTKDDPYKREHEVRKLQIEYVRKRYGREIGDSGD